jgi:oxidase EvaA
MKEFDGVLHCLMQAKMEPGNPNLLQLSPTVQATRSNYMQVHRGAAVRYLEYFAGPDRGRVVADVLQSEHGAWFYHKRNRNMVVEVPADEDVEVADDFCWLTLAQLDELLALDHVVNMDARTVLACMPDVAPPPLSPPDPFRRALAASRDRQAGAVVPTTELMSWFTDLRSGCELEITRIPLYDCVGWDRSPLEISRPDGRFFRVVGVEVEAASREVSGWTQPLFEPHGEGVVAFVVKEFGGVLHILVHARVEGGFRDAVELGPTVQCVPWNYGNEPAPPFLDQVPAEDSPRIRYQARHSEEGGRFLNATARYLVVEADENLPDLLPREYTWVTMSQLSELVRHGQYINVQARTLLACLNSLR